MASELLISFKVNKSCWLNLFATEDETLFVTEKKLPCGFYFAGDDAGILYNRDTEKGYQFSFVNGSLEEKIVAHDTIKKLMKKLSSQRKARK